MRRKRYGFTALAVMVVWLSIMPVAMAAPAATEIMTAVGTGNARALDLDVLGLVRLTIAAADGQFKLNTQGEGSAETSGRAVGICNLITGGSDPLACSAGNVATSKAPPDSGLVQNCLVQPTNVAIITVEAACGKSESKVAGATPTGDHTASLAAIRVGVNLDLKTTLQQLVGTVDGVTDDVTQTATAAADDVVPGLLPEQVAALLSLGQVTQVTDPVLDQVTQILTDLVGNLTNLAVIKVLPAEVHINGPAGTKKTAKVEATSSVVDISLLDGLVQLQVTPSLANGMYDGDARLATCDAKAAIVGVKVKNILGGGELINLAPGQNLAGLLGGLGNGLVGIKVASATPKQESPTGCKAEARGLELNLLSMLNGGIALRVAATNAQIEGAVTPLSLAAGPVCPDPKGCLPLTGGPTYLYMTGAFIMALGALGGFRVYRKLSASA